MVNAPSGRAGGCPVSAQETPGGPGGLSGGAVRREVGVHRTGLWGGGALGASPGRPGRGRGAAACARRSRPSLVGSRPAGARREGRPVSGASGPRWAVRGVRPRNTPAERRSGSEDVRPGVPRNLLHDEVSSSRMSTSSGGDSEGGGPWGVANLFGLGLGSVFGVDDDGDHPRGPV